MPMRIQSTADFGTRGLDAYFTVPEAVQSLLLLEGGHLPRRILEPAAGDGAIVKPLLESGRFVVASDIYDYGEGYGLLDYFAAPPLRHIEGLVTNPPYKLAQAFAKKALAEYRYVALLVRTNWLIEAYGRGKWLDVHEPTRVWMSAERLPLMHRYGWTGKRTTSNTPYSWAIWERGAEREFWQRFYWRELLGVPARSRRKAA